MRDTTPQEIPADIKQQIWDAATRHSANIDQDYKEDTERDFYAGAAWAYRHLSSPVPIEQEGWIKVSEKMPEGEVLLLTTSQMIYIGDWYVDGWRTCLSQWYSISGSTCEKLIHAFKKEDVTHWRPLPSPPTTK